MKNKHKLHYLALILLTSSLVQAGEDSLLEKDSDVQLNQSSSSNTIANTLPDWVTQNMAPLERNFTNNYVNNLSEKDKLKALSAANTIIYNNMNPGEVLVTIKTAVKINDNDVTNCLKMATELLSEEFVKYKASHTLKLASIIPENVRTKKNLQSAYKLFSHIEAHKRNIFALNCLSKVDESQRLDTISKLIKLFKLGNYQERNIDIVEAICKTGKAAREALFDKLSELLNNGTSKNAINNLTKAIILFPENVINESLEALLQDNAVDLESENEAMLFLFKNHRNHRVDITGDWSTLQNGQNQDRDHYRNKEIMIYLSKFILDNIAALNMGENNDLIQEARKIIKS